LRVVVECSANGERSFAKPNAPRDQHGARAVATVTHHQRVAWAWFRAVKDFGEAEAEIGSPGRDGGYVTVAGRRVEPGGALPAAGGAGEEDVGVLEAFAAGETGERVEGDPVT